MVDDKEIVLTGGRNTVGVVRIGDTVRKPIRSNTKFLHNLLNHLEAEGFDASPRVLGFDDKGREILTFIEGTVASEYDVFSDEQIIALSKLIRKFHDITSNSDLCEDQEVIAHSDLARSNVIFRDNMPHAFIDFDCARPASRAFDLGYAAWKFLYIGEDKYEAKEQYRKIKLLVEAYGDIDIKQVFENILIRQSRFIQQGKENNKPEMENQATKHYNWCIQHIKPLIT